MVPVPIDETFIRLLCGRPVCVVMQNGDQYIGRLTSCEGGKLILNGDIVTTSHASAVSVEPSPVKKRKGKKNSQLQVADTSNQAYTSAFDPYRASPFFPGGRLALDLGLVSLFFLLFI
ncbi:hypothetical protein AZ66_26235 [Paenibacillus sp. E194]|uniref:hypothetical protein n=1 Tax=Paenibacillus sp. E194 TaxID=1458845 RepID=UPI0005C8BFC3|nr:hypothetical protein [Paenibacillus sp. E194]KJB85174.1 hypothetical protein AZ66_26235 [Paenibacillus sp. E194]